MKQLPQASATGNIHIGTIAGKLNGVMPATTPSGCRTDQASIAGSDLLGVLALQQAAECRRRTRPPPCRASLRLARR